MSLAGNTSPRGKRAWDGGGQVQKRQRVLGTCGLGGGGKKQ